MKKIKYLLLCSLALLLAACDEDTEATNFAPQIITGDATGIYRKGVVLSGSIQATGTTNAKSYGILFSELESMAEYVEHPVTDAKSDFSIQLSNLTPGTTYYYCAYAHSSYSIAKGQVKKFTTAESNAPIFATITTVGSEITTCKVSASLLDEGGSEIELSGFCWKKAGEGEPTTNDHVQNASISNGSMNTELTGLEPDTEYLIRAYATNHTGVGYSETLLVRTNPTLAPTVSSITQKEVTDRSVIVEAMVAKEGTSAVSKVGFCWSTTNQTPTMDDENADLTASYQGENKVFSLLMDELKLGTAYYIRAYAANEVGTTYSEVFTFTTADPQTPVLSTTIQKESTDFTVTVEVEITDEGTSGITEAGFCWSAENKEPTLKDSSVKLTDQLKGDNKTFGTTLKDLKPGTTYYIRSYATNGEGTTYGEVITFTTAEAKAPTLSAISKTASANFSVTLEAKVTDVGTSAITKAGFCWSTDKKEPTINDNTKELASQLTGDNKTLSVTLADLKPNTTYYIRAYATNGEGTTYSETFTFKTGYKDTEGGNTGIDNLPTTEWK